MNRPKLIYATSPEDYYSEKDPAHNPADHREAVGKANSFIDLMDKIKEYRSSSSAV